MFWHIVKPRARRSPIASNTLHTTMTEISLTSITGAIFLPRPSPRFDEL
jgi:hypothetical protein